MSPCLGRQAEKSGAWLGALAYQRRSNQDQLVWMQDARREKCLSSPSPLAPNQKAHQG